MGYENVVKKAKKIESILSDMGAEGKGLNEKLDSSPIMGIMRLRTIFSSVLACE